jgi:hypothetical protein
MAQLKHISIGEEDAIAKWNVAHPDNPIER